MGLKSCYNSLLILFCPLYRYLMTTTNSTLQDRIVEHYNFDIGNVYVFEKFIVTEFNYGVDITFESFYEVSMIIQEKFKHKPFGFIANRINSYSLNLNDCLTI